AVRHRHGVGVALDLVPPGPSARPLEFQERSTGNAHVVRRPGVPEEVGREVPETGLALDALEQLLEAVRTEEVAGPRGGEGCEGIASVPVAEVALHVAHDPGMEEHRSSLAELGGLRPDVELPSSDVKVAHAGFP